MTFTLEHHTFSDNSRHETPILLLHGMWEGAWCWEGIFLDTLVAAGYEVHTMSLRGHAASGSDRPLCLTGVKHYLEDVAAVVEKIGKPPVLIGHSMGGFVTQLYARHNRLPAAVLLAPIPPMGTLLATWRFARRFPVRFIEVNLTWYMRLIVWGRREVARVTLFAPDEDPAVIDAAYAQLRNESYPVYVRTLFGIRNPRMDAPVLTVGGDADFFFPTRQFEKTARVYGGDYAHFPGLPHNAMSGQRAAPVAARIVEWLAEKQIP